MQLSNLNSEIQLLLSKVQGEPGLPGPADATVAEAETSSPQATSSGTEHRVSINWRPPVWLQKLGPIWISFPVRMTSRARKIPIWRHSIRHLIVRKGKKKSIVALSRWPPHADLCLLSSEAAV